MEKKGAFDYILLETTGLADPGNLAPLFWVDDGLGSTIFLDGIVTLVDAKNILKCLDEPVEETIQHDEHEDHHGPVLTTAHLQISHADVIVLNKSDLVTEAELAVVKERIQSINGLATIHITVQGQVPSLEGFLLDLHAYDNVEALEVSRRGHSHLDPVSNCYHLLTQGLTNVQIRLYQQLRSLFPLSKLPNWLSLMPGLDPSFGIPSSQTYPQGQSILGRGSTFTV